MNNIVNDEIFNVGCEMVVVPISTSATISDSFQFSLEENNVILKLKRKSYELGDIEVHKVEKHRSIKYVILACSVYDQESNYAAIERLGERIGATTNEFRDVKRIAMPLLGTGAGHLKHFQSLNSLFTSFYRTAHLDAELIFCVPDFKVFDFLKKRIFTDEGVNVFRIKEIIIKNQKTKSKTLDLGNCGIRDLEALPEIFDCVHLEELILSNEWGEYSAGHWVRRKSINKGVPNILQSLPPGIERLKKLKVLICGGDWNPKRKSNQIQKKWSIRDISVVCGLTNLTTLNVSNNAVEIVGEINRLEKLQRLYLNNNMIASLPNLSHLTALSEAYLSNNLLSNVDFIRRGSSIKTLDLHANKIADLTPLKQIISVIGISDSRWTVKTINIASNPLKIPPPEVIPQGKEKVLAYIGQAEAEQSIKLEPFINHDIKLILVGNSHTGKSSLLHWFKNKTVKKDITTTHWMIVDKWVASFKGKDYAIRVFDFGGQEYYHDTHHLFFTNQTAYIILWEEKTDFFGEVEVEQKQIGNEVKKIKIQTFPLSYWLDSISFHTNRKSKTDSEKEIEGILDERDKAVSKSFRNREDWTNHLPPSNNNLGTSEPSTENILVVQNKVDSNGEKSFLEQKSFKETYRQIFDFAAISVWNQRGLATLEEALFQVLASIPLIGKEHLGTWGIIKSRIESDRFERPYSLVEFKQYCNQIIKKIPQIKGKNRAQINRVLFSSKDAESFAQYLNDIGILLYFPENDALKEKIFLNQGQVLSNIYDILLGLELTEGRFEVSQVVKNLGKQMPDDEVSNTIELMLHFKIIFELPPNRGTYIAPLYLPKEPVETIKIFTPLFHKPVYRFEYKKYIYKHVILDFFHSYGKNALKVTDSIDNYYYWKEGIVLRDEVTNEIIMVRFFPAKREEQLAYIDVYKINSAHSETFLNQVVQDLDNINQSWEITKTVTDNGEDFIPLSLIHENEANENWTFYYKNKYHKLINFKKYFVKPIKMKNIFISYSKQDFELVAKFLEHLSALQLDGKVAHWYCSELIAGSQWDKSIQKHFDDADIICFMISPNFMKTKYIHDYEIAKAFEKKANRPEFKIVPIILDFCRWNTTKRDLSQFTALPYTAKPVVDFDNQNMAWYIIQECLRLMIDEDLNPVGEDFYQNQQLPSDVQKIYARIVGGKVDKSS